MILRASQEFFTCFRTQFSWFDHIFTTNSWKNIFVWFSYHILRQRLMVYNLQFSLQLLLRRITLPLILQHLPSDDFQCYTLLSVHSTFCLDFLRWFSIPFGVLASICTPAVNVTINLYQNYSECRQLLSKHTDRFRSIFNAPHKKLWILASVLATFSIKENMVYSSFNFQDTRRILNIPSSIQPCEGKMLFDFWNFKKSFH